MSTSAPERIQQAARRRQKSHTPRRSVPEVRATGADELGMLGLGVPAQDLAELLGSVGEPLPDSVRVRLERDLGHSLAGVRVHTDSPAAEAADALGAAAFAVGQHLYFASGRFDVATAAGRRLLAHEVAHAVRADGGSGTDAEVTTHQENRADHAAERDWSPPSGAGRQSQDDPVVREPVLGSDVAADEKPLSSLPRLYHRDAAPTATRGTVRVVELLVRMLSGSLRADPDDRSGRVRGQLARLRPEVRTAVVQRAQAVLSATEFERLSAAVDHPDPEGAALSTPISDASAGDTTSAPVTQGPDDGHDQLGGEDSHDHDHDHGADHGKGKAATGHGHDRPGVGAGNAALAVVGSRTADRGMKLPAVRGYLGGLVGALLRSLGVTPDRSAGPTAERGGEGAGLASTAATTAPPTTADPTTADPTTADPTTADPAAAEPQIVDVQGRVVRPEDGEGPPAAVDPPNVPASAEVAPATPPPTEVAGEARVAQPDAAKAEVAGAVTGAAPGGAAQQPAMDETKAQGGAGMRDTGPEADQQPSPSQATGESENVAGEVAVPGPVAEGEQSAAAAAATEPAAAEDAPLAEAEPAAPDLESGEPSAGDASEAIPPGLAAMEPRSTFAASENQQDQVAMPDTQPELPGGLNGPLTDGSASAMGGPEAPEVGGPEVGAPEVGGPEAGSADSVGPDQGALTAGAPGGSACGSAAPPPPVEADQPAAGCAAGGPASAAPAPEPALPDVSALPPERALTTAQALPPSALASVLPQVGAAAHTAVSAERAETSAAPPTVARPSGAAASLDVSAPVPALAPRPYGGPSAVDRVRPAGGAPPMPPTAPPVPSTSAPSPTDRAPRPQLPGDQQLSEAQVARAVESVDQMPVTDPELAVTAGEVTPVDSAGDADPQLMAHQRESLARQTTATRIEGRRDVGESLGENTIRPHVPPGELTAAAPQDAPCPGLTPPVSGEGADIGRHPRAAVDAVAAEQSGEKIRSGVASASEGFATARQKSQTDRESASADFQTQVETEVGSSHDQQVAARRGAIDESVRLRGQWSQEQLETVRRSDSDADAAVVQGTRDVATRRLEGQSNAQREINTGNVEIRSERQRAENEARQQRERGRRESRGGFLSWVGTKIGDFIDGIKSAIKAAFDAARKLVRAVISRVRDLATRAIRAARDLVVTAISLAGRVIVAAGGVLLAAFPATRDRFRRAVLDRVERATAVVNAAADALERGVQALLDGLVRALDCALQYLEAGYLAALDLAGSAIKAALTAAQQFLDTIGEWVDIVRDVASDPLGWLRALGRAVVDGARNCLWAALKRSVKEWFNSKVESVLGVGRLIFDVLIRGCISMAQIGRMAWDGIKAALPGILVQLLIEKLVSLLVPAGAALMLIIDGLRAAWGAAGRILAAFRKFMAFLKAVRSGQGAGAFADLVASAAVAVLDFLSNFLVTRLRGAGAGVGSALTAIAGRMGAVLRRVGRVVMRGVRAAGRVLRRGASALRRGVSAIGRGAVKVVRRGGAAIRRGVRRAGQALAKTRVGRYAGRQIARARAFGARQRDRLRELRERRRRRAQARREAKRRERERRRQAAPAETRDAIASLLSRRVGSLRLRAELFRLRLRYGWKYLRLVSEGGNDDFAIHGSLSPDQVIATGRSSISLIDVGEARVRVTNSKPDERAKAYEQAVGRQYVHGPLAAELFPGKAIVGTVPGPRRKRSGKNRVAIDAQHRLVRGQLTGHQPFRPDWIAEVRGPGGRRAAPTEVHAIEATLNANWEFGYTSQHKVEQVFKTLAVLVDRYPDPRTRITYHIISDRRPSEYTRNYIERKVLGAPGGYLSSRVRVVWRVVPIVGAVVSAAGGQP
jgi:Domain of unknown function (DUF4157)